MTTHVSWMMVKSFDISVLMFIFGILDLETNEIFYGKAFLVNFFNLISQNIKIKLIIFKDRISILCMGLLHLQLRRINQKVYTILAQ